MTSDLQTLVDRHVADRSPASREAAVLAALPLVRSILGKISAPDHPLASDEDLESVGLTGLLESLDAYDPSHGTRFTTYAYVRIRGAIVDYLRSIDVLSQRKREQMWEASQAAERLRQRLGDEPADWQIADELGISPRDYDALLAQANLRFALGLEDPTGVDDEGLRFADVLEDEGATDAFRESEDAMTFEVVRELLAALPSRERAIVALHYFEDLTLGEVGRVVGLSKGRVSQILGRVRLQIAARLEPVAA